MMKKMICLFLSVMLLCALFTSGAVYAEGENPETQSEEQQTTEEQKEPAEEQENPAEEQENPEEPLMTLSAGTQEAIEYMVPVFNIEGKPESGIKEWTKKECTEYQVITGNGGNSISYTDGGWYVLDSHVVTNFLTLGAKDTVTNVILCDGYSLKIREKGYADKAKGILTAGTVNFYGQKKNTGVISSPAEADDAPGIGSRAGTPAAQLNFYGGTIEASAGSKENAAGIGFSKVGDHSDTVTIYGGTVRAAGGTGSPGFSTTADKNLPGLTIYGGVVNAYGGQRAAGIGVVEYRSNTTAYNIRIYGGTVIAEGGQDGGAGIGGSYGINASNIEIYGGNITARGKGGGAGIGGGKDFSASNITINGGTIYALGSNQASGIGAGSGGSATNIKITGGDITALGGTIKVTNGNVTVTEIYDKTVGIGAGHKGTIDGITISGGTINAFGGKEGAGIGGAYNGTVKNIEISGGTVTAIGGSDAAGIGGGKESATVAGITISDGTVTATGGTYGAGIGGGKESSAAGITISGGSVTAAGGESAAGIGGGYKGSGVNITISGGYVEAKGGAEQGAGIGGGDYGASDNILISGGRVKVTEVNNGSAAIGGGRGAVCGRVTISGGYLELKGGYWGPAIGSGANCYSGYCEIKISNAAVYCHAVAGGGYPAIGIAPFDGSNVLCNITVSGDNTKIWNLDTCAEIPNSGENLSGTLGSSSILISNGTIVAKGATMKPVKYSDTVSAADKEKLEQLMGKFSMKATGDLALLETQFTLAQSILGLTDDQMLDILANENQRIELSLVFEAEVVQADFSNALTPVIEYSLKTVATAELYDTSVENPNEPIQTGSKTMQPTDFDTTKANLTVTMPVPVKCVPTVIQHTSDDKTKTYDDLKLDGYNCTLNSKEGTVTVNIPHCSHLVCYFKQQTQKSPQTGYSTLVILSAGLLVLSACAAFGIVSLRKKNSYQ